MTSNKKIRSNKNKKQWQQQQQHKQPQNKLNGKRDLITKQVFF